MTIRMLQAWNGLHQQKIVTTLSGSDEAALVAAGIATYDLDGPAENLRMAQLATNSDRVVDGFGACVNVVANDPSAALSNTNKIQSALNNGGIVNIVAAGTVWINSELLIGNNTLLYVGTNTVIKQHGNTNKPILVSSAVRDVGKTVTANWTTGYDVQITLNNHGKTVGDYLWLYGNSQSEYRGVFEVKQVVDGNNVVVRLMRKPTAVPSSTVFAKSPNVGQRIIIQGWLDYNATENTSASGIDKFAVIVAGVRPVIECARFIDVLKYCLCVGAAVLPSVSNIHADNTNSDIVKFYGPIFGGVVDGVTGVCGDDGLSFQPKEPPAYSQYDWTNGDIIDVVGRNIKIQSTNTSPVVLYATANEVMTGVTIENVWACEHTSIPVRVESGSGLTGCSLGDITIRFLRRIVTDFSAPLCKVTINGSVRQLNLSDVAFDGAETTASQFEIGSNAVIDTLNIARFSGTLSTNGYVVICSGSAKILNIYDVQVSGTAANTGRLLNFSGILGEKINIKNSRFQSLDKIVDIGTSAAANIHLTMRDNDVVSCYGAVALNKAATVSLSGNKCTVSTNGMIRLANGIAANIYSDGTNEISGAWITRAGSEVVNVRGTDIKADITTLARFDGGLVYNTNASADNGADGACGVGVFICNGIATGSWKQLGTAGGAGDKY